MTSAHPPEICEECGATKGYWTGTKYACQDCRFVRLTLDRAFQTWLKRVIDRRIASALAAGIAKQ